MQVLEFPATELEFVTLHKEGDDMATNKETLQDQEGRLKEIETQLGIKPLPPKKTTKERLTEWVKANPWLSLALPTILTVFTVFVGYWLNHHNEWWDEDSDSRVYT